MNLIDILHKAEGIDIDGVFCRYFHLEMEECEDDDDVILSLNFDADYQTYEYNFTKAELEAATPIPNSPAWKVKDGSGFVQVTAFKLTAITE